jgi:hypothetical protein
MYMFCHTHPAHLKLLNGDYIFKVNRINVLKKNVAINNTSIEQYITCNMQGEFEFWYTHLFIFKKMIF